MADRQYEDLLQRILDEGTRKGDRTGTGTISTFGERLSYDLSEGFPLITTKKMTFRLIAEELLWFLMGDSNIKYLVERNVPIWTEWPFKNYLLATDQVVPETGSTQWNAMKKAFEQDIKDTAGFAEQYGDLGPVYGVQWVKWLSPNGERINQIQNVIDTIKTNPNSRRMVVSAWNPADLSQMALEPCHAFFQFYVNDCKLSCQINQRSADTLLGVPFNIASYSLLTHMIAQQCGLKVGKLVWIGGDTHIYANHLQQVSLQLSRAPRPFPTLEILGKPKSVFDYKITDFKVVNYDPWPAIKAPISV